MMKILGNKRILSGIGLMILSYFFFALEYTSPIETINMLGNTALDTISIILTMYAFNLFRGIE